MQNNKNITMELASKYSPSEVEGKWYEYWLKHKLFSSKPDNREPYTIVIPPPNVTGVLHMGHMLNETIQDILVRRVRMEGKNACWVPGTDHASIATEAKVVARLAERGIKKTDLTREEFLKHAWEWTDEHGGIILKQLRRLGASCDWDRTAFTMDETRSKSVIKVFCDLYRKGLIYRGVRMVNWDPKAQTALSDEEVIYKEEHSKLYYLRYFVENPQPGEKQYAVVATTRPETIMGDTAMCINPTDEKNTWLKGKRVIVPLVNRVIPVIEDDYVDKEFGTGCLKVTPAHDINDYMLGQKHNLESIDIFNDDGTISEAGGLYVGMDRFEVRKQIEKDLESAGLLERVEDYDNKVGFSERTHVPIEPKLSMQWFLKMKHFADLALPPVMNDEIKFYPAKYKNTYRHWLENIKDWCISRQLWWGHRIPAYYLPGGGCVVAETPEEALQLARTQSGNPALTAADLRELYRTLLLRLDIRYNPASLSQIERRVTRALEQTASPLYTFLYPGEYILFLKDRALVQARPIFERLGQELGDILRIGIGSPRSILQQSLSYQDAAAAAESLGEGERIASYEDLDLDLIIKSARRDAIERFLAKTIAPLSQEDRALLAVYFAEDQSLARTCSRLFLHKNTLSGNHHGNARFLVERRGRLYNL